MQDMAWKVIIFLALAAVVSAEVATITTCAEQTPKCSVSEVRIDTCTKRQDACRLKKGTHQHQISMDLTPAFTASKLKMEAFNVNAGRIKWVAVDEDACQYTTCPSEAGKPQQLNYSIVLGKKLPKGNFIFEWQVYDEADNSNMCCFATKVYLQ